MPARNEILLPSPYLPATLPHIGKLSRNPADAAQGLSLEAGVAVLT